MNSVYNAWALDILAQDTENSVSIDKNSKQVTVQNVRIVHTYAQTNSAAPADFTLSATQILAANCFVTGQGNTWAYITAGAATGPAVVLDCYADDRGFSPHQRWYTGMLCDLCNFPHTSTSDKAGVGYSNRGNYGSGQGWDAGWSVAWNVTTQTLLVQEPPGAHNWCIGCTGTELSEAAPGSTTILPNGIYESLGTAVTPGSLYLAQLKQRLGASALTNIGYADTNGTALPVVAPTFSPTGGAYTTAQTVTLASATPGAAIRYTTNGTAPTSTTGTLYTGPITIAASQTVKAIAYEGGMSDSTVSSATYTISGTTPSKFTIPAASVTASAHTSSYVPANTVDGSLSTRWAGNGDGVWIRYDLGAVKTVSYAKLAWYLGTARTYTFDVQLSTDGSTWTTVISRRTSSGTTTALETYDFADTSARYVRVVGHLSSVDNYTNITEAEIWGF